MSISKENLDERIERIKRQTEEIEKKHREAEEDRLMALKMNALVTKSTLDDDNWPKAHKFDKLDFTYDVDPEKLEESNKAKEEEKLKPKRDYKKFAEGEGPPPDPKYNFLADNERDGERHTQQKNDKYRQNSNNKNKEQGSFNKRGSNQNNSFRNGNNGGSGSGNRGGNNNKNQNQSQQNYQSKNQNRSQGASNDSRRFNDNKGGTGDDFKGNNNRNQKQNEKWKKDNWDNDKLDNSNCNKSPKHNSTASKNVLNNHQISNIHQNAYIQQYNNLQQNNFSQADYMIEKRGNITVSVSQTGEVKSVKLSSTPTIGTGRVGPRQLSKPTFQVQTKNLNDSDSIALAQHKSISIKAPENQVINCANVNDVDLKEIEMQKLHLQKLLQQQQLQQQQQQLLLQQQLLPQQSHNFPTKYTINSPEVPNFPNNFPQTSHLVTIQHNSICNGKQEQLLINQKQREQVQQQQQYSLIEHQNKLLAQQLLQQQQQQQQLQQLQQYNNIQSSQLTAEYQQQKQVDKNNRHVNEINDKFLSKNSITKSPKKDRKNLKNNYIQNPSAHIIVEGVDGKDKSTLLNTSTLSSTTGGLSVASQSVGVNLLIDSTKSLQTGTPGATPIAAPVIDPKILDSVAKELSNKPEFAKKSVQDRLLRIRQNSNSLVNNNQSNISIANSDQDKVIEQDENKSESKSSETIICN